MSVVVPLVCAQLPGALPRARAWAWSQGRTKPAARHNPESLLLAISPGPFEQTILLRSELRANKQ